VAIVDDIGDVAIVINNVEMVVVAIIVVVIVDLSSSSPLWHDMAMGYCCHRCETQLSSMTWVRWASSFAGLWGVVRAVCYGGASTVSFSQCSEGTGRGYVMGELGVGRGR